MKIKEKIKNNKGMSTIEFAISLMVFLLLFSFIADLFIITYRQYMVTEQTTRITRQIAKQSGVEASTPYNFPGGDGNYYTTGELYAVLRKQLRKLNIADDDWTVEVITTSSRFKLGSNQSGIRMNYRDPITVKIAYQYKWGLWSQFIPNLMKGETVAERSAFCEYNHNLDS